MPIQYWPVCSDFFFVGGADLGDVAFEGLAFEGFALRRSSRRG